MCGAWLDETRAHDTVNIIYLCFTEFFFQEKSRKNVNKNKEKFAHSHRVKCWARFYGSTFSSTSSIDLMIASNSERVDYRSKVIGRLSITATRFTISRNLSDSLSFALAAIIKLYDRFLSHTLPNQSTRRNMKLICDRCCTCIFIFTVDFRWSRWQHLIPFMDNNDSFSTKKKREIIKMSPHHDASHEKQILVCRRLWQKIMHKLIIWMHLIGFNIYKRLRVSFHYSKYFSVRLIVRS